MIHNEKQYFGVCSILGDEPGGVMNLVSPLGFEKLSESTLWKARKNGRQFDIYNRQAEVEFAVSRKRTG